MVYVSLDQHLPVYSYHLALVEQSDGQRRTFLYRVVSLVDLYAISEPLVREKCGDSAFGTNTICCGISPVT